MPWVPFSDVTYLSQHVRKVHFQIPFFYYNITCISSLSLVAWSLTSIIGALYLTILLSKAKQRFDSKVMCISVKNLQTFHMYWQCECHPGNLLRNVHQLRYKNISYISFLY